MPVATSIFSAVATAAPPSVLPPTSHPLSPPLGVPTGAPIPTNSFFTNLLVGLQDQPVYTHPYALWRLSSPSGMAVLYQPASSFTFASGTPPEYVYMPVGVRLWVLGLADFSTAPTMLLVNMLKMAVMARFAVLAGHMDVPLVQGMGYATAVYSNLIPQLYSAVGITLVAGAASPRLGIQKYVVLLANGTSWLMYCAVPSGQLLLWKLLGNNTLILSNSVDGCVVQVCCGTNSSYDGGAGCYPTGASLTGSVLGSTCTYGWTYTLAGSSVLNGTMVMALPHHVACMTPAVTSGKTTIQLQLPSKGVMTGYLATKMEMTETLPTGIGLAPWSQLSSTISYLAEARRAIAAAAANEYGNDVAAYSNVPSMYTSGKILDKYAYVLWVLHYVLQDLAKTAVLLALMKTAINRFVTNTQLLPLCYDTTWHGVRDNTLDPSADYGNGWYNDHHFHYGYHIHAAAVVALVDATLGGLWLATVQPWVNLLVRDVANPLLSDPYFPVFRLFDWFHGHLWAGGLFAAGDGCNQELSSEDVNFAYAMKVWGRVVGDLAMEARGSLMLAVQRRSMNAYMLLLPDNTVQPAVFVPNMVSGILFDNKLDYTTYFGTNVEYIHGIHMLPITPALLYVRQPLFVLAEWSRFLAGIVSGLTSGWAGVLRLNQALADPASAYRFFSASGFDTNLLDNGMSLTWALCYAAGVGGLL